MAEPGYLDLRSDFDFAEGSRETILQRWTDNLARSAVNTRYDCEVTSIKGQKGDFVVSLAGGGEIQAEFVVLAIGLEGNPRNLGVKGEDLDGVEYHLDDPEAFRDETIIVVGAGDSAIENALALALQNDVYIVNRRDEFSRAKDANLAAILAASSDPGNRLKVLYKTQTKEIRPGTERRLLGGAGDRRGAARDRRRSDHRAVGRDPAARLCGSVRRAVSEQQAGSDPTVVASVRKQRGRSLHHWLAGRLPADQAGDEPGLRCRRVHPRQSDSAGGPPVARIPVPRPAVRARRRRTDGSVPETHSDVSATQCADVSRADDREQRDRELCGRADARRRRRTNALAARGTRIAPADAARDERGGRRRRDLSRGGFRHVVFHDRRRRSDSRGARKSAARRTHSVRASSSAK